MVATNLSSILCEYIVCNMLWYSANPSTSYQWPYKGPVTRLFLRFLWSNMPITSKITITAYIFTCKSHHIFWLQITNVHRLCYCIGPRFDSRQLHHHRTVPRQARSPLHAFLGYLAIPRHCLQRSWLSGFQHGSPSIEGGSLLASFPTVHEVASLLGHLFRRHQSQLRQSFALPCLQYQYRVGFHRQGTWTQWLLHWS